MAVFAKLAKSPCDPCAIKRAKQLRKEAPLMERLLWEALRATAKNYGLRFRRQHAIPPYYIDFVCLKSKLAIEIDGPSHDARQDHDEERTFFLNDLGFKVLRFTNEDVHKNLEGVVETIVNSALRHICI